MLGSYYTPSTIAEILANWVVQSGSERLLEPSVGEGALVDAVVKRARSICSSTPKLRLLACDVHASAIHVATKKLPNGSEVRVGDFLDLCADTTGYVDGVVANPPFTRNHAIPVQQRAQLRKRFGTVGAAGLWVHFLLHSMSFLKHGGRMAAVVPASALFTKYGCETLERIAARFQNFKLVQILDKPLWTNGAEERGAIVLAAGYGEGTSGLPAPTLFSTEIVPALLGEKADTAFELLMRASKPLGELATIRIGAVTGCNSVFLLNEEERVQFGISKSDLRPIVGRARQVPRLTINEEHLEELADLGERTWLLDPPSLGPKGGGIRRRLSLITPKRRRNTRWLNKRQPWWRVLTSERCDAVFTYMNDQGPRIVLVADRVRCTNTLHELEFLSELSNTQRKACSLTLISTFGQLAAERIGRCYSGGMLKFELMEARKLPMLVSSDSGIEELFQRVETALSCGKYEEARDFVDTALLQPVLGPKWRSAVSAMRAEITQRRSVRRGRAS